MKKLGAMGVPIKPFQDPSYCHPLFASAPVGAIVFAFTSPVSNKMTAFALERAISRTAMNVFKGS